MAKGLPGYKYVKKLPDGRFAVGFKSGGVADEVVIGFKFGHDDSGVYDSWRIEYMILYRTRGETKVYDSYAGNQHTPGVKIVLERASKMIVAADRAERKNESEADRIHDQISKWKKR